LRLSFDGIAQCLELFDVLPNGGAGHAELSGEIDAGHVRAGLGEEGSEDSSIE
jgi:hypothetical protein